MTCEHEGSYKYTILMPHAANMYNMHAWGILISVRTCAKAFMTTDMHVIQSTYSDFWRKSYRLVHCECLRVPYHFESDRMSGKNLVNFL